ncbi:MAG: Secretion system C-terminal sorting domain [Bacteroidota bacterium]
MNVKGQGNIGVNEIINEKAGLIVHPNPCKDKLTVNGYQLAVNTIEVTDLLGQKQNILVERLTTNDLRLMTNNLPSGIYFIKATDINGNVSVGKFVKE